MAHESQSSHASITRTQEDDGWNVDSGSTMPEPAVTDDQLEAEPVEVTEDEALEAAEQTEETEDAEAPDAEAAAEDREAAPGEDEDASGDETPADEVKKPRRGRSKAERKGKFQAEIHALRRQAAEEDERLRTIRAEADSEEARLAKVKATEKPTTSMGPDGIPMTWAAYEEAGKSWDDYETARQQVFEDRLKEIEVNAKAEAKRAAEEELKAEQARQREANLARSIEKRMDQGRADYDDFEDVVGNLDDVATTEFVDTVLKYHPQAADILYHLGSHLDEAQFYSSVSPSMAVLEEVMDSPSPIALLSHLAQHPDEFDRIERLPPRKQLREMGKLAAQLNGGVKSGSPPRAPKTTKAKPPIRPVSAAPRLGAREVDSSELEFEQYVKVENAKEAKQRSIR